MLTAKERGMLAGDAGPGVALSMRLIVALAEVRGARRLLPIESAHVDGCLYHGRAGLDFAERLVELGGRVAVPTTLNVGSLDLLHPNLNRLGEAEATGARRLMDAYKSLGAQPTWTCAPYQITHRPAFGSHVAWAESNAIVFVNSVLGARTDRYGDFVDICAAITGRVPDAGLHLDQNRCPHVIVDFAKVSRRLLEEDAAWAVIGHLAGQIAGSGVPLLTGLPRGNEDRLKALGAAAASSGGVGLFHIAGVTPEADGFERPDESVTVDTDMMRAVRDQLTTATDTGLDAVCLGTPHFSLTEFEELAGLITERFVVPVYIATSRAVLDEAERRGYAGTCRDAGARIVTDTCTYVSPILDRNARNVMTNSGKWAWYAPSSIGVDVVLGSLAECVASARAGKVTRDEHLWR